MKVGGGMMDPLDSLGEENIKQWPKEAAIEYVIDHYGEIVKRIIFTYLKNHAQTDDIFQEFLITVYQKLDTFKGEAKLKSWLCRIAINKCKDYLRSPLHRLILLKDQIQVSNSEKSAEQISIEEENRQHIVNAIFQLPIKYREIFVLRYYQSLSIQEISEWLEMNESTVKTRLARGKKKLETRLGGEGFADI
ncbi:RNA polymerase sigma-70 factor (ECF subfamily) [Salirhabdus euzebyi]|uniref:RNA polymerase sigma-70 factor (ECF subfamily) n=1 Tax=Salirhabdus euzebyi TaxID=394506 RepID=A0A841Q999_9BACI|nr:sigma-70 family RNA polymerase sigma factor [Salirhabdus euzebyi]MBB6454883.1 RNA polymerase sigma-70 factor (ECF subfamily) [Salirhabdus euzebyi]